MPDINMKNLDTETLIEVAATLAKGKLTFIRSSGSTWELFDGGGNHAHSQSLNEALFQFIAASGDK